MAFVVEDGTGLSNANAFVSVADATTLLGDRIDATAWTAASTETKERAIVLATSAIETEYGQSFSGARTNEDQNLSFPRTNFIDGNGRVYDNNVIPELLELATAFRAEAFRTGSESELSPSTGGDLDLLKVDVITLDFHEGSPSGSVPRWQSFIDALTGGGAFWGRA